MILLGQRMIDMCRFVFVCPHCMSWQIEADVVARSSLDGNINTAFAVAEAAYQHAKTHNIYTRGAYLLPFELPQYGEL